MQDPMISIVVPVYKVEKYLSKCVDSILSQTFSDFELILVDDGSPDRCGEICDEYAAKDSRIRALHKKNGGLSDARNAGIDVARGEYLAFIDSDDYVAPDMYEVLYALAQEHSADMVVCNAVVVEEDAKPDYQTSSQLHVMDKDTALKQMICHRLFTVNAWNKLYKKELFSSIRYPKGMLYEDLATTYKLIDRCDKVVYTSAQKYAYVQRQGSIMNQTGYKMKADKVLIVAEMLEYFQQKNDPELFAGMIRYLLNDIYKMAAAGNLIACRDYVDELKKVRKEYKQAIKVNAYLSRREKGIFTMAVKNGRFLQFLYSRVRRSGREKK